MPKPAKQSAKIPQSRSQFSVTCRGSDTTAASITPPARRMRKVSGITPGDDVLVEHAFARQLIANLARVDVPPLQLRMMLSRDVLIQQDHEASAALTGSTPRV